MYPSSRYTTYEYEDDAVPHSSHEYYETSEYPGKASHLLSLHYYFVCLRNLTRNSLVTHVYRVHRFNPKTTNRAEENIRSRLDFILVF